MSKSKRRSNTGSAKSRTKKPSSKRPAGPSKGLAKLLTGLLFLAWLAILVFFDPQAEEHFRTPKLILTNCLALLSLAWLAFVAADPRLPPTTRLDLRSWSRDPSVLLGAALLTVAATGLFGEHAAHVRRAFPSLLIGILCLIVWSRLLNEDHHRFLLRLNTFAAIAIAALIIMVHYGVYNPIGEYRFYDIAAGLNTGQDANRPDWAPYIGSTLDLGGFLLLPMLYVQIRILKSTGLIRWLWGAALFLQFGALYHGQVLSTALVFGGASLALWWNLLPQRRFRYVFGGVLCVLLVLSFALFTLKPDSTPKRILEIKRILSLEEQTFRDLNRLLSGRLEGWYAGLEMWRSEPVFGVGLGGYETEYGTAKLTLIEAIEQAGTANWFLPQALPYFVHAHNEFIQLAAQLGTIGLLIVLIWGVRLIALLRRKRHAAPQEDIALQWSAIVGLFLLALLGFPLHVAIVAFPSLLLLSWILRPDASMTEQAEVAAAEVATPQRIQLFWTTVSIVLFALFALYVRSGTDRWKASRILQEVVLSSNLYNQTPPQERVSMLQTNLTKLDEARRRDPADAEILTARGAQYLLLGRPEAAMETYLEAARLEPRPTIYANLGRSYDMLGRGDEAAEAYVKAVRLDHQRWVRMFRDKLPEYERDRLRRAWRELHRQ